jgi:hypothetical protein
MKVCKRFLKWIIGFVALVFLISACASQIAPTNSVVATPTKKQTQFTDPFIYCAAIGTIDKPDERYVGPAAPEAIIKDLRKKAGIADNAPDDWVAAGTVWRCMDGQVWACFVGANLPCSEKADISSTPQPAMNDFCKSNPQADSIPGAVTGRATVYEWRCTNGASTVVKQIDTPDAQGFLSNFWHEVTSQ